MTYHSWVRWVGHLNFPKVTSARARNHVGASLLAVDSTKTRCDGGTNRLRGRSVKTGKTVAWVKSFMMRLGAGMSTCPCRLKCGEEIHDGPNYWMLFPILFRTDFSRVLYLKIHTTNTGRLPEFHAILWVFYVPYEGSQSLTRKDDSTTAQDFLFFSYSYWHEAMYSKAR